MAGRVIAMSRGIDFCTILSKKMPSMQQLDDVIVLAGDPVNAPNAAYTVSVSEPSSALLLDLGAIGLLRRRR